ncbi:MAG: TIGR04552 family protein [Myxococcales bacterium FL481]|nr:MAG: TIGR04552 family protein [Myxococcales bacterium FL481]
MSRYREGSAHRSGAFPRTAAFNATDREVGQQAELPDQDRHEIGLLLRGESVIDWHRLYVETPEQARRLFALNGFDPDDVNDRERLTKLRQRSISYLVNTLKLRISDYVATEAPLWELPLLASRSNRDQRFACVLLKVMHIIYHLDARELRTQLAISDSDLFGLVEASMAELVDELRSAGVPLAEFSWSRKTHDSLVTKLLVKPTTRAARVFDRLRFRLVVQEPHDLGPALHVMLHRCIPFNYVIPGQTVNSLVAFDDTGKGSSARDLVQVRAVAPNAAATENEFSAGNFRVLNFVADLPVRVDDLLPDHRPDAPSTVFVLSEFQVIDEATNAANDEGPSAHALYKSRQHARVRERLLRAPSTSKGE